MTIVYVGYYGHKYYRERHAVSDMTTIRTSRAAAVELRRLAGALTAQTGRKTSLGAALIAAVTVASRDIPATLAVLSEITRKDEA